MDYKYCIESFSAIQCNDKGQLKYDETDFKVHSVWLTLLQLIKKVEV